MRGHTCCPVCGYGATETFLVRGGIPVHQNVLINDQRRAREITRGDLTLAFCEQCGFIFNQTFDSSLLMYGSSYDNTQSYSPMFQSYLDERARYLVEDRGVSGCQIIEVGCGKGAFLKQVVAFQGSNNVGVGFDPSYVGPDRDLDGRLRFVRSFYGPEWTAVRADVVICRHVIEHVSDPVEMLRTIRKALSQSSHARVFFETPCVEWILRNQVIWDFFYEHCSLFTASSLTTAFEAAGFFVENVEHVFGGQYLWLEATLDKPVAHFERKTPAAVVELARRFAEEEQYLRADWRRKLELLAGRGGVALWGAASKGVTLANLIDPGCDLISCVVDLNPNRHGCFLPGTGHPIVSYQELDRRGVASAVLMNPNYRDENLALLSKERLAVQLY